jgi:A/G-specific adenine glycosylase
MIELPGTPWSEEMPSLERALAHAPEGAGWRLHEGRVRHVFTHFALELGLAEGRAPMPSPGLWCPPAGLGRLALPTLTRRLLRHAGLAS